MINDTFCRELTEEKCIAIHFFARTEKVFKFQHNGFVVCQKHLEDAQSASQLQVSTMQHQTTQEKHATNSWQIQAPSDNGSATTAMLRDMIKIHPVEKEVQKNDAEKNISTYCPQV
jgi:hypothetical protein